MPLNHRQIKFCEEYLIDLNATQAAIRAGYSERTAAIIGSENLTKPNIQAHIQAAQAALQQKTGITQERVLAEYARIAFSDIRKFYGADGALKSVHDLDDDSAAALAGIEVDELWEGFGKERTQTGYAKKIKVFDKVKALDALGKHLGIFETDNEQKNKSVTVNIT